MTARKAIVLAAGLGTRLRPFTCTTPKPLLPVWGEPMLARVVALLRRRGVDDIVVNCHHLHRQIESWCAANGCRASYEPEILGTGGVLNPLRGWIGGEPFYLVNGDIVMEGAPDISGPLDDPAAVGAALFTEDGPRTVEVEPASGYATCWKSPDPGWDGAFTYCGFALLRPKILDYVAPEGFSTIVEAYERAMSDGLFVKRVSSPGLMWTDAGTVQSYVDVNSAGADNALADLPQLAALGVSAPVSFLGARGSDRAFFRAGDAIAVVYDASKRGENARYAGHARWLAERGVPVPRVVADSPESNATLFEFAGSTDLAAQAGSVGTVAAYSPVVESLAKFNSLDASSLELEPPFGHEMWEWERDLFADHCLRSRYRMELGAAVAADLEKAAALLGGEAAALVHRDFQSTNILWKNGEFRFIDFQGMRLGPAVYDLASLLYDPYFSLGEGERRALAELYARASGRDGAEIARILPFAAVRRLAQALGAFGRLASVGQPQFGRWVLPALRNLRAAAGEAGLDATGALAEDLIRIECREGAK